MLDIVIQDNILSGSHVQALSHSPGLLGTSKQMARVTLFTFGGKRVDFIMQCWWLYRYTLGIIYHAITVEQRRSRIYLCSLIAYISSQYFLIVSLFVAKFMAGLSSLADEIIWPYIWPQTGSLLGYIVSEN